MMQNLKNIIEDLKKSSNEGSKFQLVNEKLLYEGRMVVFKTSTLIPKILHTFHDSILGGHSRF